ncbi:hypothetical protein HK098_008134 [Nowakowskiella sp. JEL0407]|nr:hypothetical protein HK098_008134 [Nowakowskiella sp. JEL0407]
MTKLDEIPEEIIQQIVSYLPQPHSCSKTIPNLALSCKYLHICLSSALFETFESNTSSPLLADSPVFHKMIQNVQKYLISLSDDINPIPFANLKSLTVSLLNFGESAPVAHHSRILSSIATLYSQLQTLHFNINTMKLDYETVISTLDSLCNNNVSLTTITFHDFATVNPTESDTWTRFSNSVSRLSSLKCVSLHLPNNERLLTLILNALGSVESLRELYLITRRNFTATTDSAISNILESNRLTSFTSIGGNSSRKVLESIKRCNSLTTLSLEIVAADVVEFFSSKHLPRNLTVDVYVAKYMNRFTHPWHNLDFDFRDVEFFVNFEGVEYLKITASLTLPPCIFRYLKLISTIREVNLTLYEDKTATNILSSLTNSVQSLRTLSIHLDLYNQYVNSTLLDALETNSHIKDLRLVSNSGSSFLHTFRIFSKNCHLEIVTFEYDFGELELEWVISVITNNPTSLIKRLKVTKLTGSEVDVVFWDGKTRKRKPILVIRKYPRATYRSVSDLLAQLIGFWNVRKFVVDSIVFDDLTHCELKELRNVLAIDKQLRANKNLKMGYTDGSLCLWCEEQM